MHKNLSYHCSHLSWFYVSCESQVEPVNYSENPYEAAGIAHNEALIHLLSKNSTRQEEVVIQVTSYIDKNYPNTFHKPEVVSQVISDILTKYKYTHKQMQQEINKMPLNSANKSALCAASDYFHQIQVNNFTETPKSVRKEVGKIIYKVRLHQPKSLKDSIEEAYVLSALSVGLHSYEFWHNYFSHNTILLGGKEKSAASLNVSSECEHAVLESDFHGALLSTGFWDPWLFGNLAAGNITPAGLALSFVGRAGASAAVSSYNAFHTLIVCR